MKNNKETNDGTTDEYLVPSFSSPNRKSNLTVASFNLVATVVGGGVLSLPLSFQKAGIIPATIMMIIAGIITAFTLHLLCLCSRKNGAQSFGEVGALIFGKGFELFTTSLLFLFLMFVMVAYMVLIRDIWAPVFRDYIIPSSLSYSNNDDNLVLLFLIVVMVPFLLRTNLYALRFNCYLGFASISVLCAAMVYRAYQKSVIEASETVTETELGHHGDSILWATNNFADGLYAFPIIMLAFLSSFNVISIQASLKRPTLKRVRSVVDLSITACFILMYTFGLAGYLFARSQTQGNILLNFNVGDNLIILGRVGSGLTILMAMPIITLPCREAILEFIPNFIEWTGGKPKHCKNSHSEKMVDVENLVNEQTALVSSSMSNGASSERSNNYCSYGNTLTHVMSTFMIISICYVFAVAAPGVAIVWSICGSSMAFLIAFIIPCACYIQIQKDEKHIRWYDVKYGGAWILLILSIAAAIACTVQTVWRIIDSQHL